MSAGRIWPAGRRLPTPALSQWFVCVNSPIQPIPTKKSKAVKPRHLSEPHGKGALPEFCLGRGGV